MVKPYFYAYTQNINTMGYETFLKFCKDFSIFPDLCNKLILHSNFYSLAFVNTRIIEGTNPSILVLIPYRSTLTVLAGAYR
jgi:hypothetical protein